MVNPLFKREGGIKDGQSTSVFYRPETFDVVIYTIPENAHLIKAKFQVKFENAKNPRMLTIRPNNIANFTRDGDSVIGEIWLGDRDSNPNRQSQSLLSYH